MTRLRLFQCLLSIRLVRELPEKLVSMNDVPGRSQSWQFAIGLAVIVESSMAIGYMNLAVLYLLGTPFLVLLAGLVLVWFSRVDLKLKFLCSCLPIPLFIFGFFIFYQMLPKAEPETFLVPAQFRGQFEVVFGEKCGEAATHENGRRIYQIPVSGVLIVNGPQTFGVVDRRVILVDDQGNKTVIPEFHWSDIERERLDWRWYFSRDRLTEETVGVFWAYRNCCSFIISSYGDFAQVDPRSGSNGNRFETRRNEILRQCRTEHDQ